MDTQVLVVACGPVGLTLAIDLGKAGRALCFGRAEGGAAVPAQPPEDPGNVATVVTGHAHADWGEHPISPAETGHA